VLGGIFLLLVDFSADERRLTSTEHGLTIYTHPGSNLQQANWGPEVAGFGIKPFARLTKMD
jgi:hypothetical protein